MATTHWLEVSVVYSPAPRQVNEVFLSMPRGTTILQAVQASRLLGTDATHEALKPDGSGTLLVGIWGRRCSPLEQLQDKDRVELYRALVVDPKVARRARFQTQGVRATGLFSRRRKGAKPGY